MALQLYNTLSRSIVPFEPLFPENRDGDGRQIVGMYCCGPTVHDYAHIGNFRTFVFADLVRRYLEFRGYAVRHVMNITDVEDKIIRKILSKVDRFSSERGHLDTVVQVGAPSVVSTPGLKPVPMREQFAPLEGFTRAYTAAFLAEFSSLRCLEPHDLPRATHFIQEIVALIEKLVVRGVAYKTSDGSVYFSIEKYRGCGCKYGQLVNLNFDAMRVGERVANDEYDKESVADFALWKARVPEDGDVFWPSPWGEGRPGWHIECSAMSMAILGPSFDLHLGGEDLAFPHHEDEIAQSEGAGLQKPGQPFVKHWMHGAHLLVEGKKMSKSLGNYYTVAGLQTKGYTGPEIRFLLLSAAYRETFNFTLAGLDGARTALARLNECLGKLTELAAGASAVAPADGLVSRFTAAMDDDLNVSSAWAAVFDWVRDQNRLLAAGQLTAAQAAAELAAWNQINAVFGIPGAATSEVPAEITALAEARVAAKKAKNFARADGLRNDLKALGWLVEDTAKGPKLKRL